MKHPQNPTDFDMDRLGQQLSATLSAASLDLEHDISERLRIARQRALQARPPLVLMQRRTASTTQSDGTLTAPSEEGLNFWNILASALPLLALVLGLAVIQDLHSDEGSSEAALVDTALLTDELPPNAYTDPGFVQFLKLQLVHRSAAND